VTADEALVRRGAFEVVVGGDLDRLDEIFDPRYVDHDAPDGLPALAGLRAAIEDTIAGLSARRMVDYETMTAGDRVVETWTLEGVHSGRLEGVPATGRTVRVRGIEIWRCRNGRIAERWGVVDRLGLLTQLEAGHR
jgi:ketosteroid isomerase-like protein